VPDWLKITGLVLGGVLGVLLLLTLLSGWRQLASHYRARVGLSGPGFWFCSGTIGLVAYRSCLVFTAEQEGLGLRCLPPFGLLEPPLLLPWVDLSGQVTRGFLGRTTLRARATPGIQITLSTKLLESIMQSAGRSLAALEERSS